MTKTEPVSLTTTGTLEIDVTIMCPLWADALPVAAGLSLDAAAAAHQSALAHSMAENDPGVEASIVLADDEFIRELNRDFRGLDEATNVLSFPATGGDDPDAPSGAPKLLGDIIVAFETTAAEAARQDKTLADHLCHLVVHGMLHLLGHDHHTEIMANAMEALEINVLAGLDIANPYEDGPDDDQNE